MKTQTIIPPNAVEEIWQRWPTGARQSAFYYVNGEKVGLRWWDEEERLVMECGMKGDVKRGPYRTWHENGQLCQESFYLEGKEHGITRQYDDAGNLIGCYAMQHGTGADLWYEARGVLAEERYYKDGRRHGYERWWYGDNKTIWSEQHFQDDQLHGIYREWNDLSLRRGFPQYYINGQKVNKRQYLIACEHDPSLPVFSEADNRPYRSLPHELMAQASRLCPELLSGIGGSAGTAEQELLRSSGLD